MTNHKKMLLACGIAIAASSITLAAHAADCIVTGVPHLIYIQNHFYFSKRVDEITLTGVDASQAPTCAVEPLEGGSNLIGIDIDATSVNDRMWQLIMAAKTAGTPVTMRISDKQLDLSGHCHVVSVYAM